ncbi:N-acyl homoserine lactonase family protein [Actinocrispum sp. NPDC049592]|uniref:N-acyl homoserine lactonase family protein n=1 Tax=Actinocrispum sp. NPDC049592 TaxID=3154835 RepID=UPI0034403A4B
MTVVRSLRLLRVATVRDHDLPVPAFLIGLADGQCWLVDTGCPATMIDDPQAPFAVTAESHIVGQLGRLGLTPGDISTVIVSHLDPDHCGANDEFPHARFVLQQAQYEHARESGLLRYEWMREHWDIPDARWEFIHGDVELAPGITLIECGGHVPGHQAVLVELPDSGPVLLAGDAWLRDSDPDTRQLSTHDLDGPATRASQRKLMDLGIPFVIHNHDAGQWRTLRARYT